MNRDKLIYFVIGLCMMLGSALAVAHGHSRFSLGLGYYGPGFYGGYGYGGYGFNRYGFGGYGYPYYYPPMYAYPPTVVVPTTPPVYIQQESRPIPSQINYWYYCQKSDGYYPYVKDCPGGWLPVAPKPPGQ